MTLEWICHCKFGDGGGCPLCVCVFLLFSVRALGVLYTSCCWFCSMKRGDSFFTEGPKKITPSLSRPKKKLPQLIGECDPPRIRGFCTKVGLAISEFLHSLK